MFLVKGRYERRQAEVTWDDGALSGDKSAIAAAYAYARRAEGRAVGTVPGPYTYNDHMKSALSALLILSDVFLIHGGRRPSFEGDVPVAPSVPEGAIP